MKMLWTNLLVTAALLLGSAAQAQLYKWVDADGLVHYTDRRPAEGVEPEDLPANLKSLLGTRKPAAAEVMASPYDNFTIASPDVDEVVRNNQAVLNIEVEIQPPLVEAHFLQIFLDGLEVGEKTKSTALTLQELEYGTHRLQAAILDESGDVIGRTEEVTFEFRQEADFTQIAPNLVPPVAGN